MSRILMVDDAGLFRTLESSFLRRLGCEILRAQDGSDVIRKATDVAPSLILLDSHRPDPDWPGCVRALKADPSLRAIPVVVLTGTDEAEACCDAGADITLTRPLEPGALDLALSSLGPLAHRGGLRRTCTGWVQVSVLSGSLRARMKDISRTGLFLALTEPLPLDERLGLVLRIPGSDVGRPIRAQGVVVRRVGRDPDSHLIPGVGVRFIGIAPDDERCIDRYARGATVGPDACPIPASGDRGRP